MNICGRYIKKEIFDILCSKGGRKYNRNTIFQKFISTAFSRLFKRKKQLILYEVFKAAICLFWQIKIFSKSFISRGIDASAFFYNKLGRGVRLFCPTKADKAAF